MNKDRKKARRLTIDRLEERVAPAAMGGLVADTAGMDGAVMDDVSVDADVSTPVDGDVIDGQIDGTIDADVSLDGSVDGDVDGAVDGEWNGGYGSDAAVHDDGSVTFGAPEGFKFDDSGTLDISADEVDGVVPNFPEGTTYDLDGYVSYDLPESASLSDAGVTFSGEIDPGYVAPFIPGAEILDGGAYKFPIPEDVSVDGTTLSNADSGESWELPEGTTTTDDGCVVIDGAVDAGALAQLAPHAEVTPDGATFTADNLEIDPAAGTYSVPAADAPAFDGFFPPGGSITPDGGFHYEAPDGFEANADGTLTVPAIEGDVSGATDADMSIDGAASTGGDDMGDAGSSEDAVAVEGRDVKADSFDSSDSANNDAGLGGTDEGAETATDDTTGGRDSVGGEDSGDAGASEDAVAVEGRDVKSDSFDSSDSANNDRGLGGTDEGTGSGTDSDATGGRDSTASHDSGMTMSAGSSDETLTDDQIKGADSVDDGKFAGNEGDVAGPVDGETTVDTDASIDGAASTGGDDMGDAGSSEDAVAVEGRDVKADSFDSSDSANNDAGLGGSDEGTATTDSDLDSTDAAR